MQYLYFIYLCFFFINISLIMIFNIIISFLNISSDSYNINSWFQKIDFNIFFEFIEINIVGCSRKDAYANTPARAASTISLAFTWGEGVASSWLLLAAFCRFEAVLSKIHQPGDRWVCVWLNLRIIVTELSLPATPSVPADCSCDPFKWEGVERPVPAAPWPRWMRVPRATPFGFRSFERKGR